MTTIATIVLVVILVGVLVAAKVYSYRTKEAALGIFPALKPPPETSTAES